MIEDLDFIDVEDKTKDEIEKCLDYDTILSLACNFNVVNRNIWLMKEMGIKNADILFKNRSNIFLMNTRKLLDTFSKYDIKQLAKDINRDYRAVDKIFAQ